MAGRLRIQFPGARYHDAVAPPYRWLAEKLCRSKPGSVRAYVHVAEPGVVGRD